MDKSVDVSLWQANDVFEIDMVVEDALMDDSVVPTYSVSFRLQRTTTEFAFVSVPVMADLIIEQPDGTGQLDVAKLVQRAVEMGQAPGIAWQFEDQQIQPHPIQTPPPGLAETVSDT